MTESCRHVVVKEWETRPPVAGSGLAGVSLGDEATRSLAGRLADAGLLAIEELRAGLRVRAFSHVGTVTLGGVRVTVLPKLDHDTLLGLLRYAFGFRRLRLFEQTDQRTETHGFEDLLVSQLNAEAAELLSRGLHRTYVRRGERLPTLRGRIDIGRLARDGGVVSATLPCVHHPRSEDSPPNRVLLAGLRLAGAVANDLRLRRESRRLAALLEEFVAPARLDAVVLDRVEAGLNRLTRAYGSAIAIVRLLAESQGVSLGAAEAGLRVPGFLFDMNRFFQALLARFLSENLPGYAFGEEHRLRGLVRYVPGFRLHDHRPPDPRPDFVLFRKAEVAAILDAKYRDIWQNGLPREMFYQLALYAGAYRQRVATILYPTTAGEATEARIEVRDPVRNGPAAEVRFRPVPLGRLERLVAQGRSVEGRRRAEEYARWLAFGGDRHVRDWRGQKL